MRGRGICIDLGTANTAISSVGRKTVFSEPSVVTIDTVNNIIIDAGTQSKEALGKTPENLITVKPLKGGVIADYSAAEGLIKLLAKKAFNRTVFTGYSAIVTVPSNAVQMERLAAAEAVKSLGVNSVYVVEGAMAAAIGAGMNVSTATGSMVVDIGGGTTDAAVIALGTIATGISIKKGGEDMDSAVAAYVKRNFNVMIGDNTAEKIKIDLGCAVPREKELTGKYVGRDIFSGLPRRFKISSEEVREAIGDILENIIESVTLALEKAPPELLSDVMESGISLTGGCANIYGMAKLIEKRTSFKTTAAKNPSGCALRGEEKVLSDKRFRRLWNTD